MRPSESPVPLRVCGFVRVEMRVIRRRDPVADKARLLLWHSEPQLARAADLHLAYVSSLDTCRSQRHFQTWHCQVGYTFAGHQWISQSASLFITQ